MTPAAHRLLILIAAFLFSTGGAAVKATTLSPWQVAGFRSGVAAVVLMIAMPAWRGWWRHPRTIVVGVAYAATLMLYVGANKLTTAANAIFLQATAPLYLLLLAPWLLRERLRARDLPVAATVAVGMALFFIGLEPPAATAPDPLLGNLLGAAGGLGWALTIAGLRWMGRQDADPDFDPAGASVAAGNTIAFLVCAPLAFPVVESTTLDWTMIGYLGVFQIAIAYVCMTRGVRGVPAFEISLLLLVEPFFNPVWAWAAHGERPGVWSLAGCAVILAGTVSYDLRRTSP